MRRVLVNKNQPVARFKENEHASSLPDNRKGRETKGILPLPDARL
jgi:hypothetical protein